MKPIHALALAIASAAVCTVARAESPATRPGQAGAPTTQPATRPTTGPSQAEIDALIVKLGDDAFVVREKARKDLAAMGAAAKPALEKAKASTDPEVSNSAAVLLEGLNEDAYLMAFEQHFKGGRGPNTVSSSTSYDANGLSRTATMSDGVYNVKFDDRNGRDIRVLIQQGNADVHKYTAATLQDLARTSRTLAGFYSAYLGESNVIMGGNGVRLINRGAIIRVQAQALQQAEVQAKQAAARAEKEKQEQIEKDKAKQAEKPSTQPAR